MTLKIGNGETEKDLGVKFISGYIGRTFKSKILNTFMQVWCKNEEGEHAV